MIPRPKADVDHRDSSSHVEEQGSLLSMYLCHSTSLEKKLSHFASLRIQLCSCEGFSTLPFPSFLLTLHYSTVLSSPPPPQFEYHLHNPSASFTELINPGSQRWEVQTCFFISLQLSLVSRKLQYSGEAKNLHICFCSPYK